MDRGRPGKDLREQLGVVVADLAGVEAIDTHPLGQHIRAGKRLLHRDLLVKQHAHEERKRIAVEQRVSFRQLGQVQGHHAAPSGICIAWQKASAQYHPPVGISSPTGTSTSSTLPGGASGHAQAGSYVHDGW